MNELVNKRKKITLSVITDLATDQRVIRIAESLHKMGFEVHVIARRLRHSLPLESYSFSSQRIRCYFEKGTLQYAEFMAKLLLNLLFTKTDYLLANDLDTLLPNFLVSKLRNKYLFYDTHEYFTGVPELAGSPKKRAVWKKLEDSLFPRLKTVYTVNESVRNEYRKQYNIPIGIIRNLPVTKEVIPAAVPRNWTGKIILLAQGAGLNEGRSCIEMIEALPFLDNRFHLVFIGGGTRWQMLQQKRKEMKLEHRIDMMERMLPSLLKTYTPLAHLGVSLDSFADKNCLFNLPNKVFDYLQAGVPLFATAIPEIKNIIDQYQCGIYITDTSPKVIAARVTALFADEKFYLTIKTNARLAAKELCWEKEEEKLKEIYLPFV